MTTARTDADAPAIWLSCLHCYNSGRLVGHWYPAVGADQVTLADVHAGSRVDFAAEGCEEIWGLDIENMPVHREMDACEAARWGEIYEEVGPERWPALCAWVRSGMYTAEGDTDYPIISDFEEAYCGSAWESFKDFAEALAEDLGLLNDVPERLRPYVDLRGAWARDLAYDYTTERDADGNLHVFRNL